MSLLNHFRFPVTGAGALIRREAGDTLDSSTGHHKAKSIYTYGQFRIIKQR